MAKPFEPIGEQARWRTLYDLLKRTEINGIVTYVQMGAVLQLHPEGDRDLLQKTMRIAAKRHLSLDHRAIEAVPNAGYRVVEAREQIGLAQRRQRRSQVQLHNGHSLASDIDMNALQPNERSFAQMVGMAFAMQMDFNRRLDVRKSRLEQTLETIRESQTMDRRRTDEEVLELKERLRKLEQEQVVTV